jgi:hypothetical protein
MEHSGHPLVISRKGQHDSQRMQDIRLTGLIDLSGVRYGSDGNCSFNGGHVSTLR